jgi:hypothetical protein
MIEKCADGKYKCFKCRKNKPTESFMYNEKINGLEQCTGITLEDDLQGYVDYGHAWACVDCFLKSGFCRQLADGEEIKCKPSDRWPEERYEDLTKCIHCQMYQSVWSYYSYNAWLFDSEGNRRKDRSPEILHAFMKENRLIWGCRNCYIESGLKAIKKEGNIRWRAYKPTGENSWAEMAKFYRERGDYDAID